MQRILHGGDYNPEQWLHDPAALAEDLRLMKTAGITAVSLGIFAWSTMEPADGVYEFAWLDRIMDGLHGAGVGVFLATATAATPRWLTLAHPEIKHTRRDGTVEVARLRHNHCWSSPVYRAKSAALIDRLAARYAKHPALKAWHIDNEYGGSTDSARCYCARCLAGFQGWLHQRYGTIEALNLAWWTRFWSHDYQSWDQVRPNEYDAVEALELNWRRWHGQQVAEMYRFQRSAIRRHSTAPCFTNLHGLPPADVFLRPLAAEMDAIGYDAYPSITGDPANDDRELHGAAFTYDLMRSLGHGKPFWLIESCPGQPQWKSSMRLKRPGVHRALSLQAVAHGADTVMYFQWRAGRGGMEKLHGAVVEHGDPAKSRTFAEVAELGRELTTLDAIGGSRRPAQVAVVFDPEIRDAGLTQSGPGPAPEHRDHLLHAKAWHRALWKRGVAIDVVGPDDDLTAYKLVLVPHAVLVSRTLAARLTATAATILVGAGAGLLDEDMSCWPGGKPGPLADILGIRVRESDIPPIDRRVALAPTPGSPLPAGAEGRWMMEVVDTEGAEVCATYAGEFYAGTPALTRKDDAWFLATDLADGDLGGLLADLAARAGIAIPLAQAAPDGVTLAERGGTTFVCSVREEPTELIFTDGRRLAVPACGTLLPP